MLTYYGKKNVKYLALGEKNTLEQKDIKLKGGDNMEIICDCGKHISEIEQSKENENKKIAICKHCRNVNYIWSKI